MDFNNEKCVLIVDEALPLGLIANTAAVLGITLGKKLPDIVGPAVADKSGKMHEGITAAPVPVLRASAGQIGEIRARLYEPEFSDVLTVDFSDLAQTSKEYGDYTAKMLAAEGTSLCYLGVALCGSKKKVNKLTGSMPLLR